MATTAKNTAKSTKLRAHGSELQGPPKPRRPITSDLRQEPGALAAHAGICAGGADLPPTATIRHALANSRTMTQTHINRLIDTNTLDA